MYITLCVIAYNEENTLESILCDIKNQDYDHGNMEVVLVDSASTDNTKKIMIEFAKANSQAGDKAFRHIQILDNPKKILPAGWNVALSAYEGEAILKVDAHAAIPQDFVRKNVEVLESGEYVCGGQRPNIIDEPTEWKETLLMAESSMFGSSIAPYRNNPGRSYVKSMFHAAYRREIFEKIGGFNEDLVRTEDNEIHYRMREAGYKLCFDPEIISYQHTRNSLAKMLKQKYSNGYWIALTSGVCPKCLSLFHFVPWVFLMAIVVTSLWTIAGVGVLNILTALFWGVYWLAAVIMAVVAVIGEKDKRNIFCILLPGLFFLLHISYGVGTAYGFIMLPSWKKRLNKNGRDKKR